jgi:aldehyde:ferredoxin oxidoreductase
MSDRQLYGYNGKILRINLCSGRISVEEPPLDYYQRYLGGRGFIAVCLLKEIQKGIDPLGPENKLVFALGPITGISIPGSGRNSVGAKSPLTGCFGESEAGGFWGAELKRAGYDAIIIEGCSDKPVYLSIKNGRAELREADHLWGKEVASTHFALQEELMSRKIRTAIIGPGGEKLIRFASILNDKSHAYGRNGMGAVMGSKKLKAIAVQGQTIPPIADPQAIQNLSRWMTKNYKEKCGVWRYGTGYLIEGYSAVGNLPTHNFQEGCFDGAAKISAKTVCDDYLTKMYGCFKCPVRCKKRIKVAAPYNVDPTYGGPEYETLAAFGSNCEISDAGAICKAHEMCNRSGIDTISAGATISFAMECYEKGILTTKDTDGLELQFGNSKAMLKLLELIIARQGIGELLAEGSKNAAEKLGKEAKQYAVHVKGYELAMHDPRLKQGLGLHCCVNPAGGDHASSIHDTALVKGGQFDDWLSIDVGESIPSTELSPRKVRLLYQVGLWMHLVNYLGVCLLVPYSKRQIRDAVEAITGWPMSYWRLMKTAERGISLAKIFNLREGFTKHDDDLPRRVMTPHTKGSLKGVAIDTARLAEAKNIYYQMLGWDENGVPTNSRLAELDIEWALQML